MSSIRRWFRIRTRERGISQCFRIITREHGIRQCFRIITREHAVKGGELIGYVSIVVRIVVYCRCQFRDCVKQGGCVECQSCYLTIYVCLCVNVLHLVQPDTCWRQTSRPLCQDNWTVKGCCSCEGREPCICYRRPMKGPPPRCCLSCQWGATCAIIL